MSESDLKRSKPEPMKRVLLLGSGLCSHPIIDYLDRHGFHVTVGSRSKGDVKVQGKKLAKWIELDVEKPQGLLTLDAECEKNDVIVSLLPYVFHPLVAKAALKANKHFLTASYVSDGIRAVQEEFKQRGLVLINECGVDPGTDHASFCAVVERVHAAGGKITYFTSFAGGLPAPECDDNPFRYKFSWAPKGVLLAGKNSASFYKDGKEVFIQGSELFKSFWQFSVEGFEDFECYPNRDSKPYREIYGIPECQTVIRGTLRNQGWCEKIKKLVDLGYVEETPHAVGGMSYAALTARMLGSTDTYNLPARVAARLQVPLESHVIKAFEWLGLFNPQEIVPAGTNSNLDALSLLMRSKMTLQPHERDLMVLRHTITADYPDRIEHILSTLIDYGFANGDTSMARTTSLPLAIATRMVLERRFTTPGLTIPTVRELYEPMMAELAELGIAYEEKVTTTMKKQLWLRDEVKPGEHRAAITPATCKKLVEEGFYVCVERSKTRCFSDDDYARAGAQLVERGSWPRAPKEAIIVGLKELPADGSALGHRHVFFCHAFKEQKGWREELARFTRGGGELYDLEYLTFPDGRRVAAFGRPAGMAGAAVAALAFASKITNSPMPQLNAWKSQLHMIAQVKHHLGNLAPKVLVLGALGRSGRGAVDVLDSLGCQVTQWDLPETSKGGPFPELLDFDIVVNCILLVGQIPPFLTSSMIEKKHRLTIICDVSCDTSNPHNPLPFINVGTTLTNPLLKVNEHVSAIAIDHLPTLLPTESSESFANDLLPHLLSVPSGDVWQRALRLFQEKSKQ